MKDTKKDYLKYWRIVRRYAQKRYKLSQADLELLFFLYGERYFTKYASEEYSAIMSWDRKRFNRLLEDGWIERFRHHTHNSKALFQLTYKAKRAVDTIYDKLDGSEPISEAKCNNPLFLKKLSYTDRMYQRELIKMNEANQQQQRPSPE